MLDNVRQKVYDTLEAAGIPYQVWEHPAVFTIEEMDALHLPRPEDVYKRQVRMRAPWGTIAAPAAPMARFMATSSRWMASASRIRMGRASAPHPAAPRARPIPVSYTHLDVYKETGAGQSGTGAWARCPW